MPARSIVFQQVNTQEKAVKWLSRNSISVRDFRLFNPDFKDLNKPFPKGFWIAVPGSKDDVVGLMKVQRGKTGTG
jgi:hypothetical protein